MIKLLGICSDFHDLDQGMMEMDFCKQSLDDINGFKYKKNAQGLE